MVEAPTTQIETNEELNPEEEKEKTAVELKESILCSLYDKDKRILRITLIDNTNNKKYSVLATKKLDRYQFIELERKIEELPIEKIPTIENYVTLIKEILGVELKENENAEIITNFDLNNYIYMYKTLMIIPEREL